MNQSGMLVLEDGTVFYGQSIGPIGISVGEVVFNTSMTGYQEIITDPSYAEQIITFTYPNIGNVGINSYDYESKKTYIKGIIVRNFLKFASNYKSQENLDVYLKRNKIIAVTNIDTRRLTHILRKSGSQNGCILSSLKKNISDQYQYCLKLAKNFYQVKKLDLAKTVTTQKIYGWNNNEDKKKLKYHFHVIVYDFGVKNNILNMLSNQHCRLTIVPAETKADDILKLNPDGIFFSNGPGDPRPCTYAINAIKKFFKINIPMFGICLGHQLLALASGAQIKKMKFGHHGSNHPVQNIKTKKVMITTQNHGFTVDKKSIPKNLEITHISLFDHSIQGLSRTDKPMFSFQGHPEASPGPHDASLLFHNFIQLIKKFKIKKQFLIEKIK